MKRPLQPFKWRYKKPLKANITWDFSLVMFAFFVFHLFSALNTFPQNLFRALNTFCSYLFRALNIFYHYLFCALNK